MILLKVKYYYQLLVILLCCVTTVQSQDTVAVADMLVQAFLDPKNVPPQPVMESRYFVEDLKAPMWTHHAWGTTVAQAGEVAILNGVRIVAAFDDPQNRLQTAYKDLENFLMAGGVTTTGGVYTIETAYVEGLDDEAFKLEVKLQSCRILSSGVNGIRKGIFYVEDAMLRRRGAILQLGNSEHFPQIKKRIIRGYFSPTKRRGSLPRTDNSQPAVVDELMNDIDYYPEEYLNRLAHEGVNGLWLSISGNNNEGRMVGFGDLVETTITPGEGINGERRLSRLCAVVERCLRYGIKIYIFTIEPCVRLAKGDPIFNQYKEEDIIGDSNVRNLCAGSEAGQRYLYEATNKIFSAVPELGGMINISHGERYTTCLSSLSATGEGKITCPRCSKIPAWKILHQSLSAMEKGMHAAAAEAELISWLYMPQPQTQSSRSVDTLAGWVYDIPAHTPKGVILQFNFTSGVERTVMGKKLIGGDYWLIPSGPSLRYEKIATLARANQTPASAKIQTATSHEITTVPYVPVPSALYKKFAAMRRLGVSHVMLSWYFGNAPGLMVKATDLLSFDELPDEAVFLNKLASVYWKRTDVADVVKAWKYFEEGYDNYPLTNLFQYYGPMHDGPVWPLLLNPVDAPLSPTWLLGSTQTTLPWPPSGDRIGDCFTSLLTLQEVITVCEKMSTSWNKGVEILRKLEASYWDEPDRILDIGVAKAVGIQLRSGYNILRFYNIREQLLRMTGIKRLELLKVLQSIVHEELALDNELLLLSRCDSRLEYHPEAEGYKYYPAKIRWRMNQLLHLLAVDFPEMERQIRSGELLYPAYTGEKPIGQVASGSFIKNGGRQMQQADTKAVSLLNWQSFTNGSEHDSFKWAASYDEAGLYIVVRGLKENSPLASLVATITVKLQPRRLWPSKQFSFKYNSSTLRDKITVVKGKRTSMLLVQIPWADIGADRDTNRIRMDLQVVGKRERLAGWSELKPVTPRLEHGTDNPNDFGWLILKEKI